MNFAFPRKLSLGQLPTPFYRLLRIEKLWGEGNRIWIKRDDLTGCALTGNKVRKLEFIAAHAIDNGYDTLITCGAMQSNHCRATALIGAQLGLQVHLVLVGQEDSRHPQGNFFLDKLAGSKITLYDQMDYKRNLDAILLHWKEFYAQRNSNALIIPTGGSDGLGIWGYILGAKEIGENLAMENLTNTHLVCATGSGGTQAGLHVGTEVYGLPLSIWGVNVSDSAHYFIKKIERDIVDLQHRFSGFENLKSNPKVLDGYVGEGYGKADPDIYRLISDVASSEGIVLDPVYTAKAFRGMLSEIKKGTFGDSKDIIFLHTGGIFGLLADNESVFID